MKNILVAIMLLATASIYAQQKNDTITKWMGNRPDGHAPISVMGDHVHGKGKFMISYRYMYMNMEDLKRGNDDVSNESVLLPNGGNYMVTPTKMPMQMHMFGGMFAPTDNLTLMAMAMIVENEMDHITAMGGEFTTTSAGFGDTKISGLYKFFNKNASILHGKLGVSLPTGSIDEMDVIPASAPNEVILPYPMQIGSGTFDVETGLTYLWQSNTISGGNQLDAVLRTGKNDNEYRLGNRYSLDNWIAYKATNWLSFSARVEGLLISEIEGANPLLNPTMVITADTSNSGGTFINGGLGFNIYVSKGTLKNLRLGFEFASPLLQDVNGVQLKINETITTGIQYAF